MLVDIQIIAAQAEAQSIVEGARESGLDAVVLTGFQSLPDPSLVSQVRGEGLKVFQAIEVPLEKGHLLAFPPEESGEWGSIPSQLSTGSPMVPFLKEKGFAVVACHPYHKELPSAMGDRVFQHAGLDAIVVVTGASSVAANDLAVEGLETLNCAAVGGSADSAVLGKAATLFLNRCEDQAGFVQELRTGDYWAVALGDEDRWSLSSPPDDDDRGPAGPRRFDRDRGRPDRDRGRSGDRRRFGDGRGRSGDRGRSSDRQGRPGPRNDP